MSDLRIPTMKELEQMGPNDASKVLDAMEVELERAIAGSLSEHGTKALKAQLRTLRKRRAEFFRE